MKHTAFITAILTMVALPLSMMAEEKTHVRVNLTAAGTLQDVLMDNDYDRVDSLTVTGKFSGEDLSYLRSGTGRMSNLEFIDLTDIEIVECDKPYYTWTEPKSSIGGYGNPPVHNYYLSPTEYTTSEQTGALASQLTTYYHHTPNLDYGFCGNRNSWGNISENFRLKEVRLPKASKSVGEFICNNCKALERVVLPMGCQKVGNLAFWWCENLTELANTELVDSVGASAFYNTRIDAQFPPMKYLGDEQLDNGGAFEGTLIKSVAFTDGIKLIPKRTFSNCNELTEVRIPGSAETIGASAFQNCSGLTRVSIGEGTKTLGEYAFAGCSQASDFTIPSTIEAIGRGAFDKVPFPFEVEDGVSYVGNIAYTVNEETTDIVIRKGTTVIVDYFGGWGATWATSLKLPSTLKSIGACAFGTNAAGGAKIASLSLPEGLEHIGDYAFSSNYELTSLTIPANIKTIGDGAFAHCIGLVRVNWNAVDATGLPFSGCPGIEKFTFGEGVCRVPDGLCASLSGLVRVTLSSTIEEIGESAFSGCAALKRIDWAENGALKKIGDFAFWGNMAIEKFVFPEGLQEIGNSVFGTNSSYASKQTPLRSITIPSTVTHIGYDLVPYAGCQNVEEIISYIQDPMPIGGDGYAFDYFGGTLYVPAGTLAKYEAQPSWRSRNIGMTIKEFDPAGISTPTSDDTPAAIYNLQGQRTTGTRKGLYVKRGKKVIR